MRRALLLLGLLALWWWCRAGDPPPGSLRVGTFNIRSFPDAETDLGLVAERVAEMDVDLFAIQEIRGLDELDRVLADASARTGRHYAVSNARYCATDRYRIAIAYDRAVLRVIEERPLTSPGRCSSGLPSAHLVLFEVEGGGRIGYLATHLKAGGGEEEARRRRREWRELVATVESLRREIGAPLVVAGDFNTTGWHDDRHGERSYIDELLRGTDLRLATGELPCTAYWRPDGGDTYAPSTLDHILLAGAAERVRALGMCDRQRCEPRERDEMADDYRRVSDHCPVVADLSADQAPGGDAEPGEDQQRDQEPEAAARPPPVLDHADRLVVGRVAVPERDPAARFAQGGGPRRRLVDVGLLAVPSRHTAFYQR